MKRKLTLTEIEADDAFYDQFAGELGWTWADAWVEPVVLSLGDIMNETDGAKHLATPEMEEVFQEAAHIRHRLFKELKRGRKSKLYIP